MHAMLLNTQHGQHANTQQRDTAATQHMHNSTITPHGW